MKSNNGHPACTPSAFGGLIGVARRDITAPVGIYSRLWGAAKHDTAEGIHRPLTATAIAFIDRDRASSPLVLVSVDLAHFGEGTEFSDRVAAALAIPTSSLMIACTHTHSSPWMSRDRDALPGGQLLADYRKMLVERVIEAAREAIASAVAATLTWGTGRCGLAANRDQPEPHAAAGKQPYVCGFNPDEPADDTLLVGRITRDQDEAVIGTVVNYACHPTTLGWDNRLLSPDYVGAMRELVEGVTGNAPCAFVQGASGDQAPAWQYVGETSVADQHGRALGYAVLSALELMLPPGRELYYEGKVESGTALGVWRPRAFKPSGELRAERFEVELPLKTTPAPVPRAPDTPSDKGEDRVQSERLRRRAWVNSRVGTSNRVATSVWSWRVGSAILVGLEGEPYSIFQRTLRQRCGSTAVVVMGLVNGGGVGYLHPPEVADLDLYQVWQSPFDAQALPMLTRACQQQIERLMSDEREGALSEESANTL